MVDAGLIRAVLAENLVLGALGGITGLLLAVLTIPCFAPFCPRIFHGFTRST